MTSDRRVEDGPLITGQARYLADLCDSETLQCWFVRSPFAHGTITSIDTEDAAGLDGVIGIFTADDVGLPDIPGNTGRGPQAPGMQRPPLARSQVRYAGEAVAVAVATSRAVAEDAAGLVWVDIDELPAVTSLDDAVAGDTLLFPEAGTNVVAATHVGDGAVPAGTPVSVTIESVSQRLAPNPVEPLTVMAQPHDNDLTVWCGHQAPHRLRDQLARFLDVEPGSLRVIAPAVGGAFGMKGMLFAEYLVVARLAQILGRKVAWIASRRENMATGTHGRAMRHIVTLTGAADGDIASADIDITSDLGAYPHNGLQLALFSRLVAPGLYDIPSVKVSTRAVVTNLAPVGSYRGAGRPEAALAIERAVDAFARAAGLDPFEVRFRNFIQPEQLPHQTATGAIYDSGDYPGALRKAVELLDLPTIRSEQQRRLATGADPIGVGVGAFIERAGGAVSSGEYAKVSVDPVARRVVVRTGSTDQGQGHDTVWQRVVGDIFDLDIEVISGDTAEVAAGVGTFASRSTQAGAAAAFRTAERVFEEARRRAAERMEASEHDVIYRSGTFSVVGSPGPEVDIFDLAAGDPLEDEEMFVPGAQTFPYGVHAAVVEVSLETGLVSVTRIVAVDDCGTVVNEMLVHGQLQGSLAQGLGQALYESVHYDETGQLLSSSLMDYLMPRAPDVPPIRAARLEHPAPSNPLGAKGVGETGCIGLPPAILNATLDALAPFGVTDLQLPLKPADVWGAIQRASRPARA